MPDTMNVIRVTEGDAVWWHVTKGDMAGDFETVADYIPDEATAHRIAASGRMLEAIEKCLYALHSMRNRTVADQRAYELAANAYEVATGKKWESAACGDHQAEIRRLAGNPRNEEPRYTGSRRPRTPEERQQMSVAMKEAWGRRKQEPND